MAESRRARVIRGNLLLVLAAMIWGGAFVAQKSGGAALGSLTFNGVRSALGALGLLAVTPLLDKWGLSRKPATPAERKTLWLGGAVCGVALFAATNLQQIGLQYTTVGKGGFITALYIVLVPLLGVFAGKRIHALNWCGVAVALAGLYFLCGHGERGLDLGDLLLLLCALLFALQILAVSHFSPRVDGVRLSCIQFLVVGALNAPFMFVFEQPSLPAVWDNIVAVLYAGLLSSGVAYTLQIVAQKDTEPTVASLLMSLESVFAVVAGWLLLQDRLSMLEWIGCALMFVAILLAQFPSAQGQTLKGD